MKLVPDHFLECLQVVVQGGLSTFLGALSLAQMDRPSAKKKKKNMMDARNTSESGTKAAHPNDEE